MGGLASVAFYGAGKAVEALKQNLSNERENLRAAGKYIDEYGCRHDKVSDYLYGDKFIVEEDPLMYAMNNRNGGKIVVSIDAISGRSFINTIKYYNQEGHKINILSGTHGTAIGESALGSERLWNRNLNNKWLAERRFYKEDLKTAHNFKRVKVYDITILSDRKFKHILNGHNVIICAWCFSERSVDVINVIRL